jgi:hypothetical protein
MRNSPLCTLGAGDVHRRKARPHLPGGRRATVKGEPLSGLGWREKCCVPQLPHFVFNPKSAKDGSTSLLRCRRYQRSSARGKHQRTFVRHTSYGWLTCLPAPVPANSHGHAQQDIPSRRNNGGKSLHCSSAPVFVLRPGRCQAKRFPRGSSGCAALRPFCRCQNNWVTCFPRNSSGCLYPRVVYQRHLEVPSCSPGRPYFNCLFLPPAGRYGS